MADGWKVREGGLVRHRHGADHQDGPVIKMVLSGIVVDIVLIVAGIMTTSPVLGGAAAAQPAPATYGNRE